MAHDEHQQHAHQQPAALDLARQQHAGQRGQRHDPGIDGEHQTDLLGRQAEARAYAAEQADGNEFAGVENKGRNGQGDHRQPGGAGMRGRCGHGERAWRAFQSRESRCGKGRAPADTARSAVKDAPKDQA
ncbi:hypothetical protein D3C78_1373860 [compost metagenome]